MASQTEEYKKLSTCSDEEIILAIFRKTFARSIKFCHDNNKTHFARIINSLVDRKRWEKWKNNSVNTNFPPDFVNNDEKLLLEVMRVDHYTYLDDKGNVRNKNTENIGKIVRLLVDDGRTDILDKYVITGAVDIEEHSATTVAIWTAFVGYSKVTSEIYQSTGIIILATSLSF